MKKVLIVVGTRPNFIKVTRFREYAKAFPEIELKIAHTGQHSDANMAQIFFEQFNLQPDYFLNLKSITPSGQIGEIITKLSELVEKDFSPDLIITPGDVNSTLAVAIAANKMGIKLAHLESGLRSFDRSMPEEINRILTDQISDYCFVTEKSGLENLNNEKIPGRAFFVGNTMIDTLCAFEEKIENAQIPTALKTSRPFVLMTIHRPANVDSADGLIKLTSLIATLAKKYSIIFPVHPRTKKNLSSTGRRADLMNNENIILTDPLGYFEFQSLVKRCKFVLTDSGGIQEETTYRKKPCLTLRTSTERPVTVEIGTNVLVNFNEQEILQIVSRIEDGNYKSGQIPELWDGHATERVMKIISQLEL